MIFLTIYILIVVYFFAEIYYSKDDKDYFYQKEKYSIMVRKITKKVEVIEESKTDKELVSFSIKTETKTHEIETKLKL
jgi:hypothetical protein